MDSNHRNRILCNIDELVYYTDFDKLCDACFQYHLLSPIMIENIRRFEPRSLNWNCHDDDDVSIQRERHKQLFIKITKRGPEAFEKLRKILVALKCEDALKILFDLRKDISLRSSVRVGIPISDNDDYIEENNNVHNGNNNDNGELSNNPNIPTLHEYQDSQIQPKENIQVRKATNFIIDPKIGSYLMESKDKRGIFFMVRSDHQQQFDEYDHLLLSIFQQLNFKLYAYCNISYKKFTKILEELLKSDKIKDIECFYLFIRTAGAIDDNMQKMKFNDGTKVTVKCIQNYFNHDCCPELLGRPKIFVFPYYETLRITETEGPHQHDSISIVAQLSDIINCYVTYKGYMDHRDDDNFPLYIQNFVAVIAEKACNTHFENMLKEIHHKVVEMSRARNGSQLPKFVNICFNKTLYLNPGIYN